MHNLLAFSWYSLIFHRVISHNERPIDSLVRAELFCRLPAIHESFDFQVRSACITIHYIL
jgi:hypothetical protein